MATLTVDPAVLERWITAARTAANNWPGFLASHPELVAVPPSALPGWSVLVAAGAYFLGSIGTEPRETELERIRGWLLVLQANLREPFLSPAQVTALILALEPRIAALAAALGTAVPPDLASIVPSPSVVQRATGTVLADAVARVALWQRAHHGRIHVPLTVAESTESAALHPFAAAVAGLGATVADAFRVVVGHMLPELRHQLVDLVRQERQARRAGDLELRADLRERAQHLAQRIGDVVTWLRTEALPEVRQLIRTEAELRKAQDRALASDLAAEAQARESSDLDLATQVAPLAAWFGSFGLHTTTKVKTHEQLIDQLGRMDLGLLLSLAAFPNLVELVTRILVDVGGHVPGIVGALEDAASEALGAVR